MEITSPVVMLFLAGNRSLLVRVSGSERASSIEIEKLVASLLVSCSYGAQNETYIED
ncbi:hypothetical protein PO118_15770 [Bacteroides thetaiotaomicron]|uniref:hypothetical protein n=1 Tax=Bacteroides thetaiotaomicron TaxID=818 RepID=UPI001E461385|nr:hypothetical protein [Bacteroides thetaiotaomicron]MDC2278816.1 hypothetical protein [Bacteroides thetaiotaomicron]MDC2287367.1 hypothetical protein [Bacteroides thetaiotaomicron]MDC2292186.1 hypothetical protein [Bacteroides thetaiotaomicron]MDC2311037.1 hypothetical protein [Bacteroides thetaiotaomicron]